MMTDAVLSGEEIRDRIGRLPRLRLAALPTPLQPCPRLSAQVGVDLWGKRDDRLAIDGLHSNLDIVHFSMTAILFEPDEDMRLEDITIEDIRIHGEGQRAGG